MRRSQRLFALFCALLLVGAALVNSAYAQEAPPPAAEVAESAPAASASASAPPGITLLIFGIGVGFVIMVGTVLIFREQYEARQGKTPSL